MDILSNLDLLSVGIAIAGIGVLGFSVFFNNTKGTTNRSFLFFALITIFWSIANYAQYNIYNPVISFWILRIVIFFAVWHAFSFFQLAYVFPRQDVKFPKFYRRFLLPIVILTAIITLTPLVFNQTSQISAAGKILQVTNGPGIAIFGLVVLSMILSGVYILFRKTIKADGVEKKQFIDVSIGTIITFLLLITFNFILPAFFNNPSYIPLGALFIFPFVAFTAYAITRYKLFNIKVISTALVTFVLTIITFAEIIFADTPSLVIFRSSIFVLVLIFGINLIRGVVREVDQREKIEKLAAELELSNERQEGLIHFISHQIKGYLTKSKAAFATILEGDFGVAPPEMQNLVKTALEDNQEGVDTVMSILSAANLKKGTVAYKRESFDFQKVVVGQIEGHKKDAVNKGLTMETYIAPDENYQIIGDSDQISQHVIGNLIDNSIKYTLKGGLKISLSKKDGKITFSIKDTGVGITEEDKKRLFTEGGRGKESTKVNVDSTGYGLFIAKEIVVAHKGRVWAESEGPGKGSTFFVELPALS
jgi:signal transduction histidine kinase